MGKRQFRRIELNTEQFGVEHLGHIVENQLIRQALYQAVVAQENAEVIVSRPVSLGVNQDNAILGLENGEILVANWWLARWCESSVCCDNRRIFRWFSVIINIRL